MLKTLKNLFEFFRLFKIINKYANQNFKIVFYSENQTYQKYSYILLNYLAENYPHEVLYVSSDKNDVLENKKIIYLHIGNQFLLQFFFIRLKAKNLFTTTTDLGNNILSKTKKVKNYIYYFHSPVSTTKVYTAKAFDNYDTILCIGEFQKNEIQKREEIDNKKVLIVAHGNSLRALVKYLNNVSDENILKYNIPTGAPLVFELDKNLKSIKDYYLGDQDVIAKKMASVENQGKAK